MKKLLKSKKALSPVVAAIILIAVTVAVSIAVAVWMGSLSFNFMNTETLQITSVDFGTTNTTITINYQNTGTTDIILSTSATVTGYGVTGGTIASADTEIGKGTAGSFDITLTSGESWNAGSVYNIELLSTKGNKFTYTATA